jgi:hypothetical protein
MSSDEDIFAYRDGGDVVAVELTYPFEIASR